MKIILFGRNGQIGWELQRSLNIIGEVISPDRTQIGGNLSEPLECSNLIRDEKPDVVVNAAAYTWVDRAEDEVLICKRINATAVDEIATACAETGALFIHYSTDYVFPGTGARPWVEDDAVSPLNIYGQTKLEGEQAIRASGCRHLIFRTSWVYGVHGNNFPKKVLKAARQLKKIPVVSDQFGAPTSADLIADVTAHSISRSCVFKELSGVYHLAPEGETTWFGYAKYLIENARSAGHDIYVGPDAIVPTPSSEFKTAAIRPLNSRLNVQKIQKTFGLNMPDWRFGVKRFLQLPAI